MAQYLTVISNYKFQCNIPSDFCEIAIENIGLNCL